MNRFRIGIALLVLLAALGFGVQSWMDAQHLPTARLLDTAASAAAAGRPELARMLSEQARQRWQEGWRVTAAFADHQPMEDIDSLMVQLSAYLQEQTLPEFAANCRELSRRVAAMADAHRLRWWNVL